MLSVDSMRRRAESNTSWTTIVRVSLRMTVFIAVHFSRTIRRTGESVRVAASCGPRDPA